MPRGLSRLVAVIALLAFLSANSHAAPHAQSLLLDCSCGDADAACCGHCGAGAAASDPAGWVESGAASPCHGDDHPGSSCPCPGGCAFCCVAKVPSLSPVVAPAVVTPCLEDSLDEKPRVYAPPFCVKLTRPPRS